MAVEIDGSTKFHDEAESEEGLTNLIELLDENFKSHTYVRKVGLWR